MRIRYTGLVERLKRSLGVRLVAVFLLTWTGVDLAVPQLCAADGLLAIPTSARVAVDNHRPPSPPNPDSADCFCCAHAVVASIPPNFDSSIRMMQRVVLAPSNGPRSAARVLYHPPRTPQL